MKEITVKQLKQALEAGEPVYILDVREAHEVAMGILPGAKHIPLGHLQQAALGGELDAWRNERIVVNCRSGGRSASATALLGQLGFSNVSNLVGGVLAWKAEIDPAFQAV